MTDYAAIARVVRAAHDRARRDFLQRLAIEQARIQRDALEASAEVQDILRAGGPHVIRGVRESLLEAELRQGQNIMGTIERAPSPVLRRLDALRVDIGRAIPDRAETLPPGYLRQQAEARARTTAAYEPFGRFRARVGPAREATIQAVSVGLTNGASIRQIAQGIRAEAAPPPQIPAYVEAISQALARNAPANDVRELARDVRVALARLGSATEAQSWRTIRPSVERLARAVESGNNARIENALRNYTETKIRFEAARIARTEASRAASAAQVESAQRTIGVTGLKWQLSSEHPIEDICDVYARADLYGLGPGIYPIDNPPDLPAHPNCLCTLVPAITAESIIRSIKGEPHPPPSRPADDSPEAWLRRQSHDVQARVLGPTLAERMRGGATVISPAGLVLPVRRVRLAG